MNRHGCHGLEYTKYAAGQLCNFYVNYCEIVSKSESLANNSGRRSGKCTYAVYDAAAQLDEAVTALKFAAASAELLANGVAGDLFDPDGEVA